LIDNLNYSLKFRSINVLSVTYGKEMLTLHYVFYNEKDYFLFIEEKGLNDNYLSDFNEEKLNAGVSFDYVIPIYDYMR